MFINMLDYIDKCIIISYFEIQANTAIQAEKKKKKKKKTWSNSNQIVNFPDKTQTEIERKQKVNSLISPFFQRDTNTAIVEIVEA